MSSAFAVWLLLAAPAGEIDLSSEPTEEELRIYRNLSQERGTYARVMLTGAFGRGFRFNNPFRLETQLGATEESVSLTAPYHDVGLAVAFGPPNGVQHGGALRFSIALEGVAQQALSLGYLLLYRDADLPLMGWGRLGASLLTAPDANVGGELALGFAAFFTGGAGVFVEGVGNLFYGAGTYESAFTVVPVLSLQGGLIADFEVLP